MPRPKTAKTEDRQTVTVTYSVIPAFIVTCDDPRLSGISGIGKTAKDATMNLRAEVRHRYPVQQFDIVERTNQKELMLATGWKEPTYD